MDNLRALGRGTQIMFVAAVLLLIDSFLRWEKVDLGPLGTHGWSGWHGFFGVVMGILTIILVARIAARLAAVDVPIPLSFATTSFVLGVLIAICAILRLLTVDLDRTIWAWIGAALAILVAVGAWLEVQQAGGMEHLKAEASSLGGSGASATAAPAATAPAAPAPAPPAAPPAEASAPAGATESALSDAPPDASDAGEAASDAAGEAAGTTSDEPSSEQGA
jgi:hypothetical protein